MLCLFSNMQLLSMPHLHTSKHAILQLAGREDDDDEVWSSNFLDVVFNTCFVQNIYTTIYYDSSLANISHSKIFRYNYSPWQPVY